MIQTRYTPKEVSNYLIKRWKAKRDEFEASPSPIEDSIAPTMIEEHISNLMGLVRERQELLRQVICDERDLKDTKGLITQAEMMAILEKGRSFESLQALNLRTIGYGIDMKQGLESSLKAARLRLLHVTSEIRRLLTYPGVEEAYRNIIKKKVETVRIARNVDALERVIEMTDLAQIELFSKRNKDAMALTMADIEAISRYDMMRKVAIDKMDYLMRKDEVYYEVKRRSLLRYRRQLINNGFVETDTIKESVRNVVAHLKLGIPVLLRGHLGTGKTEIALHVARRYFGCEPEFISGSEETTKYDLYGRTQIGQRSEEERRKEFRYRMEEYIRMNPDAGKEELKEIEKEYFKAIVIQGHTMSFFQDGPVVRAMKEGKPLIIDEIDGIPHSIIMRLNHLLTRKEGDSVMVQEDGGQPIIIKKGFSVMATGNIKSSRYKREELDAAFLSRWWSIDIKYPPQEEAYEMIIASLLDSRGDLHLKSRDDLEQLKRLSEAASEIQKIFAGERLDYYGEGADAARHIPASLKKSVLSLRHLWNIIRPWKANNFDKPIEFYILNEFIKSAVVEDQLYLVQLFCRFRFFKNWKAAQFGIPGLTEARLQAFQGKSASTIGKR